MLFDCFIFYNELDILSLRLHELSSIVDRFVLVEAATTFTGKPKPLFFEQNKHLFEPFLHKIEHIVIKEFPETTISWDRETYQRNALANGLDRAQENDILLLSDVDEIPRPEVLNNLKNTPFSAGDLYCFELKWFEYFFNLKKNEMWVRNGPRAIRAQDLTTFQALREQRAPTGHFLKEIRRDFKARKTMGQKTNRKLIPDAGWHFSWMGGSEKVSQKAGAISVHSRFDTNMTQEKYAAQRILDLISPSAQIGSASHSIVPIDEKMPAYLRENLENFQPNLITDETISTLRQTASA